MNTIFQITRCWFLAALVLCAAARATGQTPLPVDLQDFNQMLRKTVEAALSSPPPKRSEMDDFIHSFLTDRNLEKFPHPRGKALSIISNLQYVWGNRGQLMSQLSLLQKKKANRAKKDVSAADLLNPSNPPSDQFTPEEEELLRPFKEREKTLLENINRSFAELDEMAKDPEYQKFSLPAASPCLKAMKKLQPAAAVF